MKIIIVGAGEVGFHIAPRFPGVILQLPRRSVECVANNDVNILVSMLIVLFVTGDNFLSRNAKLDADVIEVALVMMVMLGLDHHAAAHDPREKLIELRNALADLGFDCIGVR